MEIKPGDVLFVWGKSLFDEAITVVTHGPSHCAMFVGDSVLCEAQAGKPVGEVPLSFYLNGNAHLEVWTDLTLTDDERKQMVEKAKTFYGEPYDYILIPLELAHFELEARLNWFHEHKHVICSTLLDDVAAESHKHWSKVPNPAPVDLLNGGALQKKGELGNGGTAYGS